MLSCNKPFAAVASRRASGSSAYGRRLAAKAAPGLTALLIFLAGCGRREIVRPTPQMDADSRFWVRVLLLPGCLSDAKKVIEYLHSEYGESVYISIMSQYTPFGDLERFPELKRRVRAREYERLVDYAVDLGVVNGFTQDVSSSGLGFIPSFDCEGLPQAAPEA